MIKNIFIAVVVLVLAFKANAQSDTMSELKRGKDNLITKVDTATYALTDSRDGNIYKVVKIGNQVWMAENLKYLPSVTGPSKGSRTKPYYYVNGYYGTNVNDAKATAKYNTYGVLYNWPAAMNEGASSTSKPSGVQGICPCDWHLPSDVEWEQLIDYLGIGVAGGKLKQIGTTHWNSPNTGATNETGFTALPGNYRKDDGTFASVGEDSDFWSATEDNSKYARFLNIHFNESDVGRNTFKKEVGFSVRCVKD